jgi:hypothetical protein
MLNEDKLQGVFIDSCSTTFIEDDDPADNFDQSVLSPKPQHTRRFLNWFQVLSLVIPLAVMLVSVAIMTERFFGLTRSPRTINRSSPTVSNGVSASAEKNISFDHPVLATFKISNLVQYILEIFWKTIMLIFKY